MTTENSDVVALSDEASSADTPQEEVIDWEARAKAAEDRASKAENDLKSQRGRRNRQQEQNDLVLQLSNQQRITDRKLDALMKAMGTGDTDTLPEQLTSIQGEQANLNATAAYTNTWTSLSEDLVSLVQDEQGIDLIDLQTSPELAEVRTMWTDAHNRKDVRGLQAAVSEAQKVMRQVERGQRSTKPAEPSRLADLEEVMLSAGDSLASLGVIRGSKEARKMTVTSGRKWQGLLRTYNLSGPLARTSEALLNNLWGSRAAFLTWKASGTASSHLLFQLVPSMHSTEGIEFGLWPTPTTQDNPQVRGQGKTLGTRRGTTLGGAVRVWPTPRASEYKDTGPVGSKSHTHMLDRQYLCAAAKEEAFPSGKLNPTWVEWLMGFPTGWTELNHSEMPLSPKSSRKSEEQSS